MSYKSPIEIAEKMSSQMEDDIMKTIISYDINVDKAELLKALAYDREQYEKGYADGQRAEERKWIPVTEALPEEGRSVIVSSRSGSICIAKLVKGISQETRRKMENGEIDNPDVKGWCLSDGWTTSKRSNIFQEGDEWGNNSKDYAWRYGPYHFSGQEFIAWMPLPEPAIIGDVK